MNDKDLAACREAFEKAHKNVPYIERYTEMVFQNAWVPVWRAALSHRQPEIDALKAENAELKTKWLSPETYQTLMQERVELLHKTEELTRQVEELKRDAERCQLLTNALAIAKEAMVIVKRVEDLEFGSLQKLGNAIRCINAAIAQQGGK